MDFEASFESVKIEETRFLDWNWLTSLLKGRKENIEKKRQRQRWFWMVSKKLFLSHASHRWKLRHAVKIHLFRWRKEEVLLSYFSIFDLVFLLRLISCSSFKCRFRNSREWLIWENTQRQLHEDRESVYIRDSLILLVHYAASVCRKFISNWVKILKEINQTLINQIRNH